MNHTRTRITTQLSAAATVFVAAALTACSHIDLPISGEPDSIADYPEYFIAADSARIGTLGTVTVTDTMLRVSPAGYAAIADTLARPADGHFTYRSAQPLVDALYALEAAGGIGPYTSASAWRAYLAPLPADSVARHLDAHRSGTLLLPTETKRYIWPVVNDDPIWLLGAAETATAAGDRGAYRSLQGVARAVADRDAPICWNNHCGLFRGLPSYLAAAPLPGWMEPTDIFECMSLADNTALVAAANTFEALDGYYDLPQTRYLPISADSLRRNINTLMWMPNLGRYSAMLYGSAVYPVKLMSSDNAAMALAILGGIASEAMTATAVQRTPVSDTGIADCTPSWADSIAAGAARRPSPLLRQAYWTAACARARNEAAYSAAVSALLYRRLETMLANRNPRAGAADRAVTALILRGFAGMRFIPAGIEFAPFVPENIPGEKVIEGLRYRGATLNIRLSGTGCAISTFTLDGIPAEPFVPGDLTGEHTVTITLAGASAERGVVNLSADALPVMPGTPPVTWSADRTARIGEDTPGDDGRFLVYINGTLTEEIYRHTYSLYDAPQTTTVMLAPVSGDNTIGFSTAPFTFIPVGGRISVSAAGVARGGTRIVSDKTAAARLVETNRYRNPSVRFDVEVTLAGTYLIDVRYLNGLGIVNKQRRTVLRRLEVNGSAAGILVFPQLSPAWWDKDLGEHWQELTSRTNAIPVELHTGTNTIAIRYYQPSPVYLDPNHNTVLLETINLTYINPIKKK